MKYSFLVAGALASVVGLSSAARDARACTVLGTADITLAAEGEKVPADAPLVVTASEIVRPGALHIEATAEGGGAIPLAVEPSATETGVRLIRPADRATFPAGKLELVFRYETKRGKEEHALVKTVEVRGALADYHLELHGAVISQIVPEEGSSKVRCVHPAIVGSCTGVEETVSEIASRWHRVPVMTATSADPPWTLALFDRKQRWTARHADGTVEEKKTEGIGQSVFFDAPGVEYCVETTMTPRAGVDTPARQASTCVPNGNTRFEWTEAENEAQIALATANSQCGADSASAVDAPAEGGCAVTRRHVGDTQRSVLLSMLAVGMMTAAACRRSRRR